MSHEEHAALGPEREALRRTHGVRELSENEEGGDATALPASIYGFTGAPAAAELPLYGTPIFRGTEVHKTADGEILLLGYVAPGEAAAIEQGAEPLTVDLYPDPYESAQTLVAVPLSRIDHRKPPTRVHGNPMRTDIAAAAARAARA